MKDKKQIQVQKIEETSEMKASRDGCFRRYDLITLILLFFIFSFLGWLWEVGLHLVLDHALIKRGIMHGPWLPIYGVGSVIFLGIVRRFVKSPPFVFAAAMIISAPLEFFVSWYLELTRGVRWWDYTDRLFNFKGRVCLEGMLIFGIIACVIVFWAAPFFAGKIDLLSKKAKLILVVVLIAAFLCDFLYSRVHPNVGVGITYTIQQTKGT